jgi:hypothetical protein
MWQRRFVSREELLKEYPMSDEKPSPGPWEFRSDKLTDLWLVAADDSEVCRFSGPVGYAPSATPGVTRPPRHADAALIADAWQLPQLREENRQMRELIVKLRTAFYGMSLAAFDCKPLPMDIGEADQLLLEAGALLGKHGRSL